MKLGLEEELAKGQLLCEDCELSADCDKKYRGCMANRLYSGSVYHYKHFEKH